MVTEEKGSERKKCYVLVLLSVILITCCFLMACYRWDNKYTKPRPFASNGVTQVNMEWYHTHPFFYLVDGWEYYKGEISSPEELKAKEPDTHLYIGRYGGFDLGDRSASPYGSAAYRMVISTDDVEREYALELTQIYSRWRIWVNGIPVQSVGMGDPQPPAPDGRMAVFRAGGPIEIVVAVSNERDFYSGMVYPPLFGRPQDVGRILSIRLLVHGSVCAVALVICLFCLGWSCGCHLWKPYIGLALLCLCFSACVSWPIMPAFGLYGSGWRLVEQIGYYGIFLIVVWLQGEISGVPQKILYPVCAVGLAVIVSIPACRLVQVETAAALMDYGRFLTWYKWFSAAWLTGVGLWSARREQRYALVTMVGAVVFASSLMMDRLLPIYEPVISGWFVEISGAVWICLTAGILWYDAVRLFKESTQWKAKQELAAVQLKARADHAVLQQEYVRSTRKMLHESRSRLALIRHYLDTGNLEHLSAYLDELTLPVNVGESRDYSGHPLLDALLSEQLTRAESLGIYLEPEIGRLPGKLGIADGDLTLVVMNLLDNAIEGCVRIEDEQERWISLQILGEDGWIEFQCRNASVPPADTGEKTSKKDKMGHGFGLEQIREITEKYHGSMDNKWLEDCYQIVVRLNFVNFP